MEKIFEEYGDMILGMVEVILWIILFSTVLLGDSGILSKVLSYFSTNLLGG